MRLSTPRRLSVLTALWAAVLALTASTALAATSVLPPDVKVGAYTVQGAARAVSSSNLAAQACAQDLLPDLPFRNLCAAREVVRQGAGLVFRGERSVTVRPGRTLFTVLGEVTDGEPVIGTYPQTRAQARDYWFDEAQLGGSRGRVTVDGVTTTLGRQYVVGPYEVPELPDGGTRVVAMGTFLAPLALGRHVVHKSVTLDGAALRATYGIDFIRVVDTFRVTVQR